MFSRDLDFKSMTTNLQQLEQQSIAINARLVAALNQEFKRLNCPFSVRLSSDNRFGDLVHDLEKTKASRPIDDWIIDLLETLRYLVKESPLPDEMALDDKNMWVFDRIVSAELKRYGTLFDKSRRRQNFL